jgi:hypothetical protein
MQQFCNHGLALALRVPSASPKTALRGRYHTPLPHAIQPWNNFL